MDKLWFLCSSQAFKIDDSFLCPTWQEKSLGLLQRSHLLVIFGLDISILSLTPHLCSHSRKACGTTSLWP